MNWQGVVLPVALALITAIATNWFQRPKVKQDVKSGETDDEIKLRKMRVEEQVEVLRQSAAARDSAIEARNEAVAARVECERRSAEVVERVEAKYDRLANASENLADSLQGILTEPDDIAARQTARLRLREYRQAI
jgi:hypothetical protein